jgi:hypothetical protein
MGREGLQYETLAICRTLALACAAFAPSWLTFPFTYVILTW